MDWTEEKACFDSILRELAYFHITSPLPTQPEEEDEDGVNEDEAARQQWQIQHVLVPALRSYLVPPKTLIDQKAIVQVASLPELYKVFERC